MRRLDTSDSAMPRKAEWPANPEDSRKATLFTRRTPLSTMVIMVDSDLLVDLNSMEPNAELDKSTLITGLISHPLIRLYRFADKGPPASVKPEHLPPPYPPYPFHTGWVVLGQRDEGWPVRPTL
jgi:hypothetical protein